MEQSILVNFGGDILALRPSEFTTLHQRNWLHQPRVSGDNSVIAARVNVAWQMYVANSTDARAKLWKPIAKLAGKPRGPVRFMLRCKLTKWGVI